MPDAQSKLTSSPRFLAPRPVSRTIFGTLHSADNSSKPRWGAETSPLPQRDAGGSDCQVRLPTRQHLCGPPCGWGPGRACSCDHSLDNTQWQHCSRTRESKSQIDKWPAATCVPTVSYLISRYRSPSPLRGWSMSTHIPDRVSLRPICLLSVSRYPKRGGCACILLSFFFIIGGLNKSIDTNFPAL